MPYELVTSGDAVDLWSDERLPFEPVGELREMRDALGEELRKHSGARLTAWLSGPKTLGFDLENVLFYNVGGLAFSGCCREYLRFERRFTVPPAPSRRIWRWHHHYEFAEGTPAWAPSKIGTDVRIEGSGSLPESPAVLWAKAQRQRVAHVPVARGRPLFLRLRLQTPRPVNLVSVTKVLVDGLCCSFHSYIGALLPEVALRAADATGESVETVLRWLARDGPLGPARFVWPYGSRLQWSPEDDRIVALELTGTATGKPRWAIDVGLYEAEPL